ncbi:MAG TPA: SDR family oxidoreductase [Gammaproteobacteria bacterium]|jgi:NADP-dependent 3-hydroxy acid dehydrogenase YdfG|nr:SDR family oxidoreductase [Gammaproteobacteria bacterium]
MDKSLVVITGASSGIGAAMAKIFSAAGYPICLLSRSLVEMTNLQLPNSLSLSVDVTDVEAFKKAVDEAESQFGPVDLLCNNAGFVKAGDFVDISHEMNETMVDVNIKGVINGLEIVLSRMRERKKGTIINTSSISDRNARPNIAVYAATKAAVKSLTESLRMANAKYGIRICNLTPAKIRTPMMISTTLPASEVVEPEAVAEAALWMYEQESNICIRDLVIAPTLYEP